MPARRRPRDPAPRARGHADARDRLLVAAARVFARHGAGGATTRRIAGEAGVNEVTLFRLFGSKEALLDAAVHATASGERPTPLPEVPVDPARELTAWCAAEIARLRRAAELLRQCFAESEVHAGHVREAALAVGGAAEVLRGYVARLGCSGAPDAEARETAVAMLVSTVMADALGRDTVPGVFAAAPSATPARYVAAFLRLLGASMSRGDGARDAPGAGTPPEAAPEAARA